MIKVEEKKDDKGGQERKKIKEEKKDDKGGEER